MKTQRTIVQSVMILTVIIYVIQLMPTIGAYVTYYGAMIPEKIWDGQIWRLLTSAFLHSRSSLFHIGFNMLALWMFGRILEWHWGGKKFLTFYLLAAIASALFGAIAYTITGEQVLSVGASGAIMALFVMFAMYYPYEKIYLFAILPIEARFAVPGFALLSVYFGLNGGGGIDHFGHLGGIVAGLVYYFFEHPLDKICGDISFVITHKFSRSTTSNIYEFKSPKIKKKAVLPDEELDVILKKVSRSGVDSLTERERSLLQKHSDDLKNRQ